MKNFTLKLFQDISNCLSKSKSSKTIFLARKNTDNFLNKSEKDFLKSIKFFTQDSNYYFFSYEKLNSTKVVIFVKDLNAWKIGDIISKLPSGNYIPRSEV